MRWHVPNHTCPLVSPSLQLMPPLDMTHLNCKCSHSRGATLDKSTSIPALLHDGVAPSPLDHSSIARTQCNSFCVAEVQVGSGGKAHAVRCHSHRWPSMVVFVFLLVALAHVPTSEGVRFSSRRVVLQG